MNVTRLKLPAIRSAIQRVPWAIQPEKLKLMLEVLDVHAHGGSFTSEEIQTRISARSGDGRKPVPTKSGGIQVLPLYGVISHRMNMFSEYSGGTSTEKFSDDFDAAVADPGITAIVIDCDSPGGSVDGTPELAKRILDARSSGKRIVAVVNTLMASAAYWICSAAHEVVCTPSGNVGSIGVFTVHLDESGYDEMIGLTYTLISAGKYKTEGNPYEPLSEEARAALEGVVGEYYGLFTSAVAKHRGVKPSDVVNGYGEGRVLTAKQAKSAGLIDRIDTLDGVLSKLGGKNISASGRPRATSDPSALASTEAAAPKCATCGTAKKKADDGEYHCPQCEADLFDDVEEEIDEVTDDEGDATAAGGAAPVAAFTPDASSAPPGQGDTPVPQDTAAQPGAVASAENILAAERTRVARITALCNQEGFPNLAAELIASGVTEDQTASRLLAARREQHQASPTIRVGADRAADRQFGSFGEQLVAVVQAGRTGGRVDPRLTRVNHQASQFIAGPSGANETVGSEGGFFIEPVLLPGVIDPVYTDDPILSRVLRIPIGSNSSGVKYNVVDETARTTGNRWGGIQMAWGAEADALVASKAKLRQMVLDLKKLIGGAYLTDELMQDAPAAEALLSRAFQAELKFMLAAAIFKGTGAGQPMGIMNSGAFVQQAIEGTQTIANSANFLSLNVPKMLSRVPASLWGEVIWLYNQELLPYLLNATTGTNGTIPVFIAAGGLTNRPFDTILGRPAFGSELCEAVGTPGDILCLAPSQYHIGEKGGPQQATSLHVRFLNDETTLRITYRVDGAPVWKTTVAPYKGALARSPFVGLAVRV